MPHGIKKCSPYDASVNGLLKPKTGSGIPRPKCRLLSGGLRKDHIVHKSKNGKEKERQDIHVHEHTHITVLKWRSDNEHGGQCM